MEAITAINLASSIVALVDFATKIVTGTYEVYPSVTGTTIDNAHIASVICDLQDLITELEAYNPSKSEHEKVLEELSLACEEVANELLQLLNRLRVEGNHSTWKSLQATIKTMREDKEIAGIEKRLENYCSQILMRITLMLHDQNCPVKLQLDQLENTALNLSPDSASRAKENREGIVRDIQQLLNQKDMPDVAAAESRKDLRSVQSSLKALSSMITTVPRENVILKEIFLSMDVRERYLTTDEKRAWEWLFEEGKDTSADQERATDQHESQISQLKCRAQTRNHVLTWLRSGKGVFEISGKAGSGKSTLMKFICSHEQTRTELKNWAGEKKLVFAQLYFWKPKDALQMSLDGLYRSILFTTFQQAPELIPVIFPGHWKQLERNTPFIAGEFISYSDLVEAFETLTTTGTYPNHRFCYFMDGLEECRGKSPDHFRLAASLQSWVSRDDVKICTTSPYENRALLPDQRIRLHELTRHDIYLISRQMIEKDVIFEQIKDSYLRLVDKVVNLSDGVFLWARLVVRSLLAGMLRYEHIGDLEKKLDLLSPYTEQLFDQLLDSLGGHDRERAIRMLLLTVNDRSRHPLSSIVYTWVGEWEYPEFLPCDGVESPWWPPVKKMTDDVQNRIKYLTRGLLETAPMKDRGEFSEMQVVQFFHPTVRDFVAERLKPMRESGKYSWVTDVGTYHRLWLAELTASDVLYRRVRWNHSLLGQIGGSGHFGGFFHRPLSLDILDGFKHVLDDGNTCVPKDPSSYEVFRGAVKCIGRSYVFLHRLSFVHLAAFTGQQEYVMREIESHPELLYCTKELNLLASALLGRHNNLAKALIERGASPASSISCRWRDRTNKYCDGSFPMWLVVLQHAIGTYISDHESTHFETLEILLGDHRVNTRGCYFLLKTAYSSPVRYYATLKQVIEEFKPANMDRLLSILDRGAGNSYSGGVVGLLSRSTSGQTNPEPSLQAKMAGYIPCCLADKEWTMVVGTIWDDFEVGELQCRIF